MNTITINVADWQHKGDKEVLRTIRDAINDMIKYGYNERVFIYWYNQDRRIELQIIIK